MKQSDLKGNGFIKELNNQLFNAIRASNVKIDDIENLINQGADVNAINEDENTVLHLAVLKCEIDIIEFLIGKGANVNGRDGLDYTPLYKAVRRGNVNIIQALLNHGANVKAQEGSLTGQSPLHFACKEGGGKAEVVRILLKHGADVNAQDSQKLTPLYYAKTHNFQDIVKILESAQKKSKTGEGTTGISNPNLPQQQSTINTNTAIRADIGINWINVALTTIGVGLSEFIVEKLAAIVKPVSNLLQKLMPIQNTIGNIVRNSALVMGVMILAETLGVFCKRLLSDGDTVTESLKYAGKAAGKSAARGVAGTLGAVVLTEAVLATVGTGAILATVAAPIAGSFAAAVLFERLMNNSSEKSR